MITTRRIGILVFVFCLIITTGTAVAQTYDTRDREQTAAPASAQTSFSNNQNITWFNKYDSLVIWDIEPRPNGGYIALGFRTLFSISPEGSTISKKKYKNRVLMDVESIQNSEYIVIGQYGNKSIGFGEMMMQISDEGVITQERSYGLDSYGSSAYDIFFAVQATDDGGYLLAGRSGEPETGSVMKINEDGQLLWQTNSSDIGSFTSIEVTDNGYVLAGYKGATMITQDGKYKWNITFSGELTINDIEQADSGYILAGGNGSVAKILKLNSEGSPVWTRTYAQGTHINELEKISDDKYLSGGYKQTETGTDGWILKFRGDGAKLSEQIYGGSGNDRVYDIHVISNNKYLVSGMNRSDSGQYGWIGKISLSESSASKAPTSSATASGTVVTETITHTPTTTATHTKSIQTETPTSTVTTSETRPEPTTETTGSPSTPGFTVSVTIAALVAILIVLRYNGTDQ